MTKEEYLETLYRVDRYKTLEKKELNLKETKNRLKGEAAINIINKQLIEVTEDMKNL